MSTNLHSRRNFLKLTSGGISGLALSSLINAAGGSVTPRLHHEPKAKSVIFLYMSGGVSHVDSFDPKPALKEHHGKPMPGNIERTQFDANGNLMASPWEYKRWGESGLEMTNMFHDLNQDNLFATKIVKDSRHSRHLHGEEAKVRFYLDSSNEQQDMWSCS